MFSSTFALANAILFSLAQAISYDQYILAPSSRTLNPISVYKVNGTVTGADSVTEGKTGSLIFGGESAVTFDYAKNIAGIVTLNVSGVSDANQFIGLTFSESSLWISGLYSDATADAGRDEIYWFHITAPGIYTVDADHERGGFKYLSLVHNSTGSVELTGVSTYFTPMPHKAENELRKYTGYFHSNDELLNRIWYAGAYTNQLCTINPKHGNALVHLDEVTSDSPFSITTWYNNLTISNATSVSTDGAKRDRLAWPGDLSVAMPAILVSTNDLISIQNSVDSIFALQNTTTGMLPYVALPRSLGSRLGNAPSFTYHCYSLIGVYDFYLYNGDLSYLKGKWPQYKLALSFALSFIDSSGLANITSGADWLRFGMGGHNIEANAILYQTIKQAIKLSQLLNDTSQVSQWAKQAATIKTAANALLWNESAGLYRDNETTSLLPQDGNTRAIISNLTDSPQKINRISSALAARWTTYGAPAPEAATTISPFITSFELQAHLLAANATRTLDLIRLQWGFMLTDPRMTDSSFIEGISHAHGWATGPTGSLTVGVAGLGIVEKGGLVWRVEPRVGDLERVEAGFETVVGWFECRTFVRGDRDVDVDGDGDGEGTEGSKRRGIDIEFETPVGTTGSFGADWFGCDGIASLSGQEKRTIPVLAGKIESGPLQGGKYNLSFRCS
ncbi:Bacterial alpha-L-rhamnosidase [Venturia nashicola]|uniref:Bacterial alpha-L-rhamnosidase n=1 Tax=Venturia nashicola TaxID=86259 RepID=A0A4Z1PQI9_9PEZI|nr:Bacterial alpha-L-rhamnosidase [Venturia nashicola]TLD38319.1 Bacterial alpha-L-rhamnosidase [Venturia nashicola]